MKTSSRFALVAAAGILMGSMSLSANAADLGGSVGGDLEERVAELEATTVRKGNRKVSLELSGQVDKALMVWDDGKQKDAYIVDNNYSSTRFRLKGTALAAPGLKAGFYMEYEFNDSSSASVSQTDHAKSPLDSALKVRQENVWLESATLGRVTIGQQSSATKDLVLTNLGGGLSDPQNYYAKSFFVRDNTVGTNDSKLIKASDMTWSKLVDALDGNRYEAIRYDTPSIYGFILSAAWGENDFWDIALRFQKEWNSLRIAAGVGYAYSGPLAGYNGAGVGGVQAVKAGTDTETVSGNISVMHMPTGLYATFSAANREFHRGAPLAVGNDKDASMYYIQGGITKRFFDVGATTVYGEYGNYQDLAVGTEYVTSGAKVTGSDVKRYGVGFTQAFDRAALELYANYIHFQADVTTTSATVGKPEDFNVFYTGARIKF